MHFRILSGGAARALVQAVARTFQSETGLEIDGTFGAVGAMRDKLAAGAEADLVILTSALIAALERDNRLVPGSAVDLGVIHTGVAVRAGDPVPAIATADGLREALSAADGIYYPDPKLSTAGIHFARVLAELGIPTDANAKLLTFPNGSAAMKALAASPLERPIGCTQVTEILNTQHVHLAGHLPKEFDLATVYTGAIASDATYPAEAKRFLEMLVSPPAEAQRVRLGFKRLKAPA